MEKKYKIFFDDILFGLSKLEKADVSMGVVFGKIEFVNSHFGYENLRRFCEKNDVKLADDFPEEKMLSTYSNSKLKIENEKGIEIKGEGNQISGMDGEGFEITIIGIPYSFYEHEFSEHVDHYKKTYGGEL